MRWRPMRSLKFARIAGRRKLSSALPPLLRVQQRPSWPSCIAEFVGLIIASLPCATIFPCSKLAGEKIQTTPERSLPPWTRFVPDTESGMACSPAGWAHWAPQWSKLTAAPCIGPVSHSTVTSTTQGLSQLLLQLFKKCGFTIDGRTLYRRHREFSEKVFRQVRTYHYLFKKYGVAFSTHHDHIMFYSLISNTAD